MSLRTPRHDFGPSSSTSRYGVSNPYATPRSANPYGVASLMETPGNATINNALASSTSGGMPAQPQQFKFLSHPLFSDPGPDAANGSYLQFEGLYSQMANFKAQLDGFVEQSIRRIQDASDTHTEIKEEYRKATKEFEKDVEMEKKTQRELFTKIASEREEDSEARRAQAEKERYVHSLTAQLSDVQNELSEMKRDLANRREEKQQVASKLKEMTRLDVPEREMLEMRTGCRIDTPGDDLVSFTFALLDPTSPTQEAFFVFAISKRAYTVPVVEPAVPATALQDLIQELNRSRNAFKFVKQMRSLLKDQVVAGARAKTSLREAVDAASLG